MEAIKKAQQEYITNNFPVTGTAKVKVCRGKGLSARDVTGLSDPFVILCLNKQVFKTPTIKQTLNPVWKTDNEFIFDVQNATDMIEVSVWDEDPFKSDFEGRLTLPLTAFIHTANEPPDDDEHMFHLSAIKEKQICTGALYLKVQFSFEKAEPVSSGHKSKLFKLKLDEVEKSPDGVPLIIESCIKSIEELGMNTEGIFRISEIRGVVDMLKKQLDLGKVDFSGFNLEEHPHLISNILKLYFRELPESLLIQGNKNAFLDTLEIVNEDKRKEVIRTLIHHLPTVNYLVLKRLCTFLFNLGSKSEKTKMPINNLAIIFGPVFLNTDDVEIIEALNLIPKINALADIIITDSLYIFAS